MKEEHNHHVTSNTDGVFRTFIGCQVKGLLREITFEGHYANILVFNCGWGLAFNSNGSHWAIAPSEISSLIRKTKVDLENNQKELEHILVLAGEKKT